MKKKEFHPAITQIRWERDEQPNLHRAITKRTFDKDIGQETFYWVSINDDDSWIEVNRLLENQKDKNEFLEMEAEKANQKPGHTTGHIICATRYLRRACDGAEIGKPEIEFLEPI